MGYKDFLITESTGHYKVQGPKKRALAFSENNKLMHTAVNAGSNVINKKSFPEILIRLVRTV